MKLIIKSQNEKTSENKTPGTDQDRKRWHKLIILGMKKNVLA